MFLGNLSFPIQNKTAGTDYICENTESEAKPDDQKMEWTYKVECIKDEKDIVAEYCGVKITLTEKPEPGKGSHWALITGIVVLVVAILIGVIAFLG